MVRHCPNRLDVCRAGPACYRDVITGVAAPDPGSSRNYWPGGELSEQSRRPWHWDRYASAASCGRRVPIAPARSSGPWLRACGRHETPARRSARPRPDGVPAASAVPNRKRSFRRRLQRDVHEFVRPSCGDHPYLDYTQVPSRLQWPSGPRPPETARLHITSISGFPGPTMTGPEA